MSNFNVMYVYDNLGFTKDRYTLQVECDEEFFIITTNACASIWSISEGFIDTDVIAEEGNKHFGIEVEYDKLPEELKNTIENYFMI